MEHRIDQRIEMPLKAWVNFGDMPTLITTTRNISKSGICLAFTHRDLKASYVVDIAFEGHHAEAYWRCKALVIHTSHRGTGVLLGREFPFTVPGTAMVGREFPFAVPGTAMEIRKTNRFE